MELFFLKCYKPRYHVHGYYDKFYTPAQELKEALEAFFKECRRGVLCCYATCFGCEAVTKVFYHIAVWVVLVIVVAISYLVATVIFVSVVTAVVAVVIGLSVALICLVCLSYMRSDDD